MKDANPQTLLMSKSIAPAMQRQIRVAVLPSWYPSYENDYGGIFFREQASALATSGLDVTVISPLRVSLSSLVGSGASLKPIAALREMRRPYIGPPRAPGLDAMIWRTITRLIYRQYIKLRGVPDILHVHSLYPAGTLGPHLPAGKRVITEHSTAFLSTQAKLLDNAATAVLRAYDRRIAVSEHLARRMESLAPAAGKWQYVPNLVNTASFSPTTRREKTVRVLTASNLIPTKRIDMLIRAFNQAFANGGAELRIAGEGPERDALVSLSASLPCASRVHFLGPLSREGLKAELGQCTVFALASRYETFGVVLIEALSMGKPVVATDSGGPASIIRKGNGVLVPLFDEAAFARGLIHVTENLRAYCPMSIRNDCIARFGHRAVTAQLQQLYREVLGDAG
jgi:glycosyltransferase involved in cell wall biosynthesis